MIARALHRLSPRRERPFFTLDCGTIQESLLESELFGYVKGAFTGASINKKGLWEEAAINEAHAVLESVERERLRQALAQTHNNRVYAAKLLSINCSTLYEKLKRHHLLESLVADTQPPSYSRQIS